MTIACNLMNQSVQYDRESFSGTATYAVYDDAGALVTCSQIMGDATVSGILNGNALTSFGAYLAGTGSGTSAYPKLRYAGYSLSADGSGAKWTLTVNFDSAQSSYSPTAAAKDTIPEDTPGFTAIEMDISAAIVPTYRVDNYTLPTGGNIDAPTEADIGGRPVDQGGEPIDAFVSVMRFTVRNVQSGRPTSGAMSTILSMVNTRNSAAFSINGFSAAAGKLLLTGVQVSRVKANVYELTYSFAFDDDFHLRQMPKVDANGKPQLAVLSSGSLTITDATVASVDAAATGGIAPRYAYHVMWKQPFPGVSNFTSLSIQGLT
mgnify:CR=1 FL=1